MSRPSSGVETLNRLTSSLMYFAMKYAASACLLVFGIASTRPTGIIERVTSLPLTIVPGSSP